MVRHHRHVIEKAAQCDIMSDGREPIHDTGERRTYPNMMSREGARGQEYNAWSAEGGNPPEHETILFFTRMLDGPMDFTPGIFDILIERGTGRPRRPDEPRPRTTLAKQLALYVVLYSPLQMAADLPENYEHQPAFQFIRDVAVDWDPAGAIRQVGTRKSQRGTGRLFRIAVPRSAFRVPRSILLLAALALAACGRAREPRLFERLPPERSGVTFVNRLPDDTAFSILDYMYYYDGGGVAVADVNNDGLPDLYFTSNLGSNRLYLNKGNYRFEDITERAGVADSGPWKTGVTMADVNGDGYVDIYVSAVDFPTLHGHNVLYINNGDGTFTDRTQEYGLDFAGFSTQALFFDYDGDGDLDMYLLTHSPHPERASPSHVTHGPRLPGVGDRLYRNDGGHFVDASERAGLYGGAARYGLGVVASDLNLDGCPDLYVANDFQEDDFVYLNNCYGTFTHSGATVLGHTSHASMGVDAADVNDDGRPDLVVLDMLPDDEKILKTSANAESFDVYLEKLAAGYHPQYAHNTLQLNRGVVAGALRFSEIGYLAGVSATDWSWAPLLADLDNDGYKDLFVTTGIYHRPNDLDYFTYVSDPVVQASLRQGTRGLARALIRKMPQVPTPNYAYRNNGHLTFTNEARAWGLGEPGFSSGAAYVDLNNSGALDLVVNKLNAPAAIYRNRARELTGNHYLQVVLRGSGANTAGIGAKVIIKHGGTEQMLEQFPTRGFQSSVDPRLHFGLGSSTRIDSLIVVWPDRRAQVLTDVALDRSITLSQQDALGDRKSTRLNSSHGYISYAVFCLKKKKKKRQLPLSRTPNNSTSTAQASQERQRAQRTTQRR